MISGGNLASIQNEPNDSASDSQGDGHVKKGEGAILPVACGGRKVFFFGGGDFPAATLVNLGRAPPFSKEVMLNSALLPACLLRKASVTREGEEESRGTSCRD